jgi:hypothetical protein
VVRKLRGEGLAVEFQNPGQRERLSLQAFFAGRSA